MRLDQRKTNPKYDPPARAMTIPTENLDAMVQFLTDVSETSGDHFMRAADMLRAQQARIAELEAQPAYVAVPDGWALVPVEASKAMIYACAEAAREYMREHGGNSPSVMWRAMVAAAPSPQLRDATDNGMGVKP